PPRPRIRPEVGSSGVEVNEDSAAEKLFINGDYKSYLNELTQGDDSGIFGLLTASALRSNIVPLFMIFRQLRKLQGLDTKLPSVAKVLIDQATYYFAYLPNDMGLLSGQAARMLFESLLQKAAAKKRGGLPSSYRNITFQEHWDIFQKRLLVTGTN